MSPRVHVRAPRPTDGRRLAGLWKVLWDVHESWGSYPGSTDPRVYDDLAQRLSDEARARGGSPLHGRHVHLVAAVGDSPGEDSIAVGQVEGWIDRHGESPKTKWTCEVRSLVVAEDARHLGAARALLDELANVARHALHGAPAVLAAEVLDANPAMAFYRKLGFVMPVHSVRVATSSARAQAPAPGFVGRVAVPEDALPLAFLDANLAERRRLVGDSRFDGPRALDAALVDAIALHLGNATRRAPTDPAELVVVDRRNVPRASATLVFATLEPPFVPGVRAVLSRPSFDATTSPYLLFPALVQLAGRLACLAGAEHLEIVDLPGLETDTTRAALATGAVPWSRVALRNV